MKSIKFVRSPYGGFDGWVNGKLRYSTDDDIIDLSKISKKAKIIIESHYGTVGWIQPDMAPFTTTCTGTFDFGIPVYKPFLTHVLENFQIIISVIHDNWKTVLQIAGSIAGILGALRTFGILVYSGKN